MTVPDDAAFLVHDEGVRDAIDAERFHVACAGFAIGINRHGVIHLISHLGDKFLHHIRFFRTDADESHILKPLLQFRQMRDAFDARRTPRRPKLHHHHLFIFRHGEVRRVALDPLSDAQRRSGLTEFSGKASRSECENNCEEKKFFHK